MSKALKQKQICNMLIIEVSNMIYPSIDKLLTVVDSKYALVHVASRRARQMHDEDFYQMRERDYKCKKNIGRALEEVERGLIHIR